MTSQNDPIPGSQLNEAIVEYLLAQDRGEQLDRAALMARFPEVAAELQEYLELEQGLSAETSDSQAAAQDSTVVDSLVLPPVEKLISEFTDVQLINRGGMGIIYRARQISLNRTVALKFILLGRWASEADHERFRIEAQALGRLRHPAIAQVYSSGEVDGNPYLVMEFIQGRSLRQEIDDSPLSADRATRITLQVARAIAEAHRHQIVHRDLKPANILIDDQQQPFVTDFGLAKILDDQSRAELTVTGQIVGTPSYVSPEQARGDSVIGPSSDIYSLGTVLYACLTGQPPFRTDSISQTLMMVQHSDPPPPRLLVPQLPRDLETICLKCLEKDPRLRYATADLLADDLQRFQDGQPILARPVSLLERTCRWTRRNQVQATAIFLTGLLVAFAAAGLIVHTSVVNRLNDHLSRQNLELQESLRTSSRLRQLERSTSLASRRLGYAADMRLALKAWRDGDSRQVADLLETHVPDATGTDVRGFAWRYLNRLTPEPIGHWAHLPVACYHVTFSPDGLGCLVSCADGYIRVFDTASGRMVQELPTRQIEVNSVAFTQDGTLLASGGDDGTVRLWNWPELQPASTLNVFDDGRVFGVAFSPDQSLLFACGDTSEVKVFDVTQRRLVHTLNGGHQGRIEALAVSADGRFLATAGQDGRVAVWKLNSLAIPYKIIHGSETATSVAFLPNSTHLVFGTKEGRITVLDLISDAETATLTRPDEVQQIAVSDDGKLAVTDRGGSLSLFRADVTASQDDRLSGPTATWQVGSDRIPGVAFSVDQSQLVTAERDGRVTAWSTQIPEPAIPLGERSDSVAASWKAVCPLAGSEVLTCGQKVLTRRNLNTGESSVVTSGSGAFVSCDAQTVDRSFQNRQLIVAVEQPNTVHVIPPNGPTRRLVIGSRDDFLEEIRLLPGSRTVAVRRTSGQLSILDIESGAVDEDMGRCHTFALAAQQGVLWLGERGTGNGLIAIDLHSGQRRRYADAHRSTIRAIAVSPDETQLVSTGHDRSVALWDAASGRLIQRFESLPGNGTAAAWSPDGRTIAVCCDVHTLRLLQAGTLRDMGLIFSGQEAIGSVQFTSDGQWLLVMDAFLQAWALDGRSPKRELSVLQSPRPGTRDFTK